MMAAILYTGYGCMSYRQVSMAKTDFMANSQIQQHLGDYALYVHDGVGTYRMEGVEVVDGKDLSGKLAVTQYEGPKADWKRKENKAWWKEHKYDIHIYTLEPLNISASVDGMAGLLNDQVTVTDQMIKEIQVVAYDDDKGFAIALALAIAVVGIALILVLTIVAVNASGNASQGSITSDSGSDSGSSDSGSSGSGSSD